MCDRVFNWEVYFGRPSTLAKADGFSKTTARLIYGLIGIRERGSVIRGRKLGAIIPVPIPVPTLVHVYMKSLGGLGVSRELGACKCLMIDHAVHPITSTWLVCSKCLQLIVETVKLHISRSESLAVL